MQTVWRGLRDVQIPQQLMELGGSERACMSCVSSATFFARGARAHSSCCLVLTAAVLAQLSASTDRNIAQNFSDGPCPLVLKITPSTFMQCGADVRFLSVYPSEKEVLYPPLTFLRFVGASREKFGGHNMKVITVEPHIGG